MIRRTTTICYGAIVTIKAIPCSFLIDCNSIINLLLTNMIIKKTNIKIKVVAILILGLIE